jgi:hypothetical protein
MKETKEMNKSIKQPFSNVQLEILKTFSHQLSDSDLLELKNLLVTFFAKRLVQEADRVWEENNWNDKDIDNMLNTKMRRAKHT